MKPDFLTAYHSTISFEGDYSCDPNDAGGETWKGISRRNFPLWQGWKIIDEIRRNTIPGKQFIEALKLDEELEELVVKFYQAVFWNKLNLDATGEHVISAEIFDTAVNQGLNSGGSYFQQALNLLNDNGKYYPDLDVDGDIGENTIKALKAYMSVPGRDRDRNVRTLLKMMNGLQFQRYVEICRSNPKQEVWVYGWMNRC